VLRVRVRVDGDTELTLLSPVATFDTPIDVTVAELVIESFFPADEVSRELLRDVAGRAVAG
jgi:hypothetical protein